MNDREYMARVRAMEGRLYRVAQAILWRDMLRRRKREDVAELDDIPSEDRLCEDLQLRLALKRLPEKYRLPLLLHHMEGWPVGDVARMLNIPVGLVKSRLYQARRALRALLDGGDGR